MNVSFRYLSSWAIHSKVNKEVFPFLVQSFSPSIPVGLFMLFCYPSWSNKIEEGEIQTRQNTSKSEKKIKQLSYCQVVNHSSHPRKPYRSSVQSSQLRSSFLERVNNSWIHGLDEAMYPGRDDLSQRCSAHPRIWNFIYINSPFLSFLDLKR